MKFDYKTHYHRSYRDYEVYLKRFRGTPSPILDMGSGIGLFLEACAKNGVKAVGLEYEQEGVDTARARGLTVHQHDLGQPIDFLSDNQFAAILSNQVIEHLQPDAQQNLVTEAFRLLQPGGQLLLISPCRHFERARQDRYHIGLLTPSEIRDLVESVGFTNCNMGYNRCQPVPEIPEQLLTKIWKKYQPDLMSQSATVLAYKPE